MNISLPNRAGLKRKHRAQHGATLIEILITMLIVAIGLFGVAGMQLASTKYQQVSTMRSLALTQTEVLIEKMRSNSLAILQAAPATPANAYLAPDSYANAATLPANPNCGADTQPACTLSQSAQRDIREWRTNLARAIPGGRGSIYRVTNAAATLQDTSARRVMVMWVEKLQSETNETVTASVDPACIPAQIAGVRCLSITVTP